LAKRLEISLLLLKWADEKPILNFRMAPSLPPNERHRYNHEIHDGGQKTSIHRKYLYFANNWDIDTIPTPTSMVRRWGNMGEPLKWSWYLNNWQSYKYFRLSGRHLEFLATAMSHIKGDCTIVFLTFENMDLAVGIVSISQLLTKLQVFPCFPVFQPPSWIFHWYRCRTLSLLQRWVTHPRN